MTDKEPASTKGDEKPAGFEKWLLADEVATLLGVSNDHLRRWRVWRIGPTFVSLAGRYVLYNPRSVAYLANNKSPLARYRRSHPVIGSPKKFK